MQKLVLKYYKYLINKYAIATGLFLFVLLFSDRNGLVNQWEQKAKYNKVLEENKYFKTEIEKLNKDYVNLFSNAKNLEKYAREKYLMKRDDEDVFIIVKK
ncbi:MAG: septum formation initiator family protein [Bacteroidota bacterium]